MDASQFDHFTASLPRRSAVGGLLALALGASAVDAKKHRKRKHKKKCSSSQKKCGTSCIPSNQCCADVDCAAGAPRCCQGTCIRTTDCCTDAECINGQVCQEGTCGCPAGTTTCPGRCCQAAPGFVALSVVCGNGDRCTCDYEIDDNPGKCAGTCSAGCGVTTDCANPMGMCGFCCF